jgi:hypothetical protein
VWLAMKKRQNCSQCVCTECNCFRNCPVGVRLDVSEIQSNLVEKGLESEPNKAMKANMMKYKNPYGEPSRTKVIKQIYT